MSDLKSRRRAGRVVRARRLRGAARTAANMVFRGLTLLFVVSGITFLLVSFIPGDVTTHILGTSAPPEAYERLRVELRLGEPFYMQYWWWLLDALRGDLGTSLGSNVPVTTLLSPRISVTLSLVIGSMAISLAVGMLLGVVSAVRGGTIGKVVDVLSLLGYALPSFWVGLGLISVFGVSLGWFPTNGYVDPAQSLEGWLKSLILPASALALGGIAWIAKQTRDAMLDILGSEYIRMAWAGGIPARSIYLRHALRNAAVPVLTLTGVLFVNMVGGAVIIESVFGLPGLGSLAVRATSQQDTPVVVGVAVTFTVFVVVVNTLIDAVNIWLNPKLRSS